MLKKSERLKLALDAFEAMPPAENAVAAMERLRDALRQVEVQHSGLPDYSVGHGYQGLQLHLFAYSEVSPFWKRQPGAEANLVCQLTHHYAVFGSEGGVAVFTRTQSLGGKLVFCKPDGFFPTGAEDVRLWSA
ncbi:hypothetical protein [Stenotrophomonas sp. B1-1]|uniref:hypothetical protein n=1 Tax=Stenotrophomonas sp. B1-1 TaxID=2710648 RepID=UPI0013DC6BA8|nr:hypothetical protein [Stenotrophomonas sp. B1-1]